MTAPLDGSASARISPGCPPDTRLLLQHAASHDLPALKKLLNQPGAASAQDPETGETPLHAAIRSCGPALDAAAPEPDSVASAKHVLRELFVNGAIWNDVDAENETPGCLAFRLGHLALYRLCVDAGIRAELLLALLDAYQELSSGSDLDSVTEATDAASLLSDADEKPVTSDGYLQSDLTFHSDKLLDSDRNGVMMAWETDIMRRSVAALVPQSKPGLRVLNVGHGMGIIDSLFADLKPSCHHIIEAHPAVLRHLSEPEAKFGPDWERSGPSPDAFKLYSGKWQDLVPGLIEQGLVYDAIYFDTFGEDYSQLRTFFTEYIPALLDHQGRFSFFNGLGADRRICYDVYTKVAEAHCADAGLDLEWEDVDVDMSGLDQDGKGEWKGVRRRYWTLDKYRLPICTFMG